MHEPFFLLWDIITDRGSLATYHRLSSLTQTQCVSDQLRSSKRLTKIDSYIEVQGERARETDLYMDMFSISWVEALSYRMIPRGETLSVTFWSFFPLAFACKSVGGERGDTGIRGRGRERGEDAGERQGQTINE
jgi:hypothetical protein